MKRRFTSITILTIALVALLCLAFRAQRVRADASIYIRTNGDIEGTDKIHREGDVYTFTDDIYDEIIVERNNVTIDGAGNTLQGSGSGYGFNLTLISNVTIINANIKGFYYGVYLILASNNTISLNNFVDNDAGIALTNSDFNHISGNNINESWCAIYFVHPSHHNKISGNYVTNNDYAIHLYDSSNNTFYHNNFINNTHQVDIYQESANFWDNGFEGNLWSDYETKYPDATEIDSSGIWDTPYVIDQNNQDNYPIIPEFPSFLVIPLFMVTTLLAAITRRRQSRKRKPNTFLF